MRKNKKRSRIIILLALIIGCYFFYRFFLIDKSDQSEQNQSSIENIENSSFETEANLPPADKKQTTFIIGGDTMFDRNVWHHYQDSGIEQVFSGLGADFFAGYDLSLINLEGPISSVPINDDWQSGSMSFNFPPTTITALKYAGVKAVSLANNHTFNAGELGFANTKKVLSESGISYFGRQSGFLPTEDVLRIDAGIPLSVIAVDALAEYDQELLSQIINTEKNASRFVIIIPHWGTEYQGAHNSNQEYLAKKWISAGADLIVGSHPHVVEDYQLLDGVPVIYSLGNLVFDQYFSEETQEGLIVKGEISEETIKIEFLPVIEKVSIPSLATGDRKAGILKTLKVENEVVIIDRIKVEK